MPKESELMRIMVRQLEIDSDFFYESATKFAGSALALADAPDDTHVRLNFFVLRNPVLGFVVISTQ